MFLCSQVAPFTLDGYFPLYHTAALAAKASADSASEALGPQGERGHPRSWSTGTRDVWLGQRGSRTSRGSFQQHKSTCSVHKAESAERFDGLCLKHVTC